MDYRPWGPRSPEVVRRLSRSPSFDSEDIDFLGDVWSHTFVVVDIETTGLTARDSITEIGAVKIRGGHVVDEFSTLVNPGIPIPPKITALTGITPSMVESGLSTKDALTQFLDFAEFTEAILVAHNAEFDCGFLTRACHEHGLSWPRPYALDTLALARTILPRPVVSSHRLPTLAQFFRVPTPHAHRALADAHTCVAVFSGLIDRLEQAGARTFDDLMVASQTVPYRHRKKVALAADLPTSPGVYTFYGDSNIPLYIGSATNCRSRVRSYFSAAEKRDRIRSMLDQVERVTVTPVVSTLDARILELQRIRDEKPLFNSASRHQRDTTWLVFRNGSLEITHRLEASEALGALGPYRRVSHALKARRAILLSLGYSYDPLETVSVRPVSVEDGETAARLVAARGSEVVDAANALMRKLAETGEYEQAATIRDHLFYYLHGVERQRDTALIARARLLVWGHHLVEGGWRLHAASRGRLLGSRRTPPGTSPAGDADALCALSALPAREYLAHATWEEVRVISRDVFQRGARLIAWDSDDSWSCPIDSAARDLAFLDQLPGPSRRSQ
ncbi:MAG: exonuclease domain-containing protein [Actinomycetaceae bacterium]|nr:exonuclease domain-containing protein [Actinomycetaceae bacterium]